MVAEGREDGNSGEVGAEPVGEVLEGLQLGRAVLLPDVVGGHVPGPHDVVKLDGRTDVTLRRTGRQTDRQTAKRGSVARRCGRACPRST